jgi:hypothetical protein
MNCNHVQAELAAFLYGELEPEQAARVNSHVQACALCQARSAENHEVRRLLDLVPAVDVPIDMPALWRQCACRQAQKARHWRRSARWLAGALAAGVVLAFLCRLEIGVAKHQLTLRWGAVPTQAEPADASAVAAATPHVSDDHREKLLDMQKQLLVLGELVQGLAAEAEERGASGEARERRHEQRIARLQDQLDELRRQTTQRWVATERDLAALSGSHSSFSQGNLP